MAKDNSLEQLDLGGLPSVPNAKQQVEKYKDKLEKFKKEVLSKFDKYIMGITVLPPIKTPPPLSNFGVMPSPGPGFSMPPGYPGMMQPKPENPDALPILILIDDSDSKKMSKYELKTKLSQIIAKMATDIDQNFYTETIILSELWQNCYDAKYEILAKMAAGSSVFDNGMVSAIKISEIHKQMVLRKFEKYIVCYVLAGSLVQGKASKDSDIDVFVVIDDTDVKKMTRIELKDKLRAIIIGMGLEAGELTGIKNKLNIQVYILTDFWDNIKEANPIIFTFLRDGIPFYDRGIFMPWKQLLRMGKIKPSPEAIDLFMSSGDQMVARVKFKLNSIGIEDIFYAILTPSQAALMLYGVPPPTPKETPELMKDVFIKKEKLLETEYVKILERIIEVRKDLEHGSKKDLTGKEIDELLSDATKFLKRIKKLFKQIDTIKEEEKLIQGYENTLTVLREIMTLEGVEKVTEDNVVEVFKKELIETGKVPHKYLRMLKDIMKTKKDYMTNKLTKTDINRITKISKDLHKFLMEHIQRKRGREIERAKIRIKHGKFYGEVYLLGKSAFIIRDIDADERVVTKALIGENGSLQNLEQSSVEELEKALIDTELPSRVFIKEPIFETLREIFGQELEIMVNN